MGGVADDGLLALWELVDVFGPEAQVFGEPAPDGEASISGIDVVLATFERHNEQCAGNGGVCVC